VSAIIQGIIVFAVAFLVTFIMVPVSKKIAFLIGAVDYPGNRRMNIKPIPRCGGIALYLGILAGCFTLYIGIRFFGWEAFELYVMKNVNYMLLFIGVTIMFTVGLIDDITQISAIPKLLGQILAAVFVVLSGISISTVQSLAGDVYIRLGWVDYPLTVLILVAFVNIINLIDGLDGLAAGIVAIIAVSLMYMVLLRGSFTLAMICLSVLAVCLAFLRYNFAPASVFMGDSGSHLLGLAIGIIAIAGIMRTQSWLVLLVPVVIAGVPVLDTLSAIIRRIRGKQPVKDSDMEHIHHRLVWAGLGQRMSVMVLYLCTIVLAFIGILISNVTGVLSWVILIALAIAIAIAIWRFGLFKPVLKHYYDNRGKRGPRLGPFANGMGNNEDSGATMATGGSEALEAAQAPAAPEDTA